MIDIIICRKFAEKGRFMDILVSKQDEIIRTIKKKNETRVEIDRNGFGVWIGGEDFWKKTVNKRYGN